MKLVLAEKPSVAQSIAKVLGAAKREDGYLEGNGYVVSWCVGHLVELAQPEVYDAKYSKWAYADLPIFPMDWQYEVSAGTKKQFGILKKLMAREDVASLVCATDAGREGELIFRLVYHKAGCRKPFERLWISSMEDVAIKEGFENLRSGTEYDALYEAALCRERADWIVGINATRLFSTLYGQTLNVGRVMTPTLAMAVMREAAISAFKPELFYTVQIGLDGFTAASERFKTKAAAEAVKQSCSVAIVQKAECKEKTEKPPALYDLTSLQREANRVLGYTAQQTLDYTQNLYEKKLVTYPRTDSRFLTEDMAHSLTDLVKLAFHTFPVEDVDNINLDRTEEGHTMNSYFVAHPEMVLGDTVEESTAYGMDITVRPIEGMELSELLKEAVSHIQGTYQAVELPEADKGKEIETIPATPDVKNFSYTVVDGNVYFRENSLMRRVDLNEKAKDRVMGMVELRGIVNELIEYQLEDYPDEMITQKQAELNDAYDAFAAKNGLINNRANGQAFADDSSYYLLCSLENVDEDGNLKSKADMFTKRTIKPERRVTSVDTPSEALAISIGERGKVDLPFMAQLLGTPGEYDAIQAELRGVIFKDPMAPDAVEVGWQTADDYLSGDVRSKLRVAQMAADRDSSFHINVEALQKAQPKDLDASEIDVRLGATWIDADYIQQFMEETFETPYYLRRSIEVKFSELTAEWRINGKSSPNYNDVAA